MTRYTGLMYHYTYAMEHRPMVLLMFAPINDNNNVTMITTQHTQPGLYTCDHVRQPTHSWGGRHVPGQH